MKRSRQIDFTVVPGGVLSGAFPVPGDKSISHRTLMLGAIAEGETRVSGILHGEDIKATAAAFQQMGVQIDWYDDTKVSIQGVGLNGLCPPKKPLDLGNSGTSARLLAGLLAGQRFESTLTGDASLQRRPMQRIVTPLLQMNADLTCSENGTLPIHIKESHALKGIHYVMPVASAQLKSCLLLAGLYAEGKTSIEEPAPTRDHTERLLASFSHPVEGLGEVVCISKADKLTATDITVPGDISSAAFLMVGACIADGSDITLRQVGVNPTRHAVIEILQMMGADISLHNHSDLGREPVADIRIKSSQLHGIEIPSNLVPSAIDEFPAILIAAAFADGLTVLRDAAELRVKESDRIQVMVDGLQATGIHATPTEDGIRIEGGIMHGGTVNSHTDHRIAMAFTVAGIRATESIRILDCYNVNTSFPGFVSTMQATGLDVTEEIVDG
jgi:3-phosphoshikimate 1-carboxyvinyltransferase